MISKETDVQPKGAGMSRLGSHAPLFGLSIPTALSLLTVSVVTLGCGPSLDSSPGDIKSLEIEQLTLLSIGFNTASTQDRTSFCKVEPSLNIDLGDLQATLMRCCNRVGKFYAKVRSNPDESP
jgi:hypothetical protein